MYVPSVGKYASDRVIIPGRYVLCTFEVVLRVLVFGRSQGELQMLSVESGRWR